MGNLVEVAGLAAPFSGSQIAVNLTSTTFLSISFPSHCLLDSHSEKIAGCSLWCEFLGRVTLSGPKQSNLPHLHPLLSTDEMIVARFGYPLVSTTTELQRCLLTTGSL